MKLFSFGSFRLVPGQRLLTEDGRPVRLGGRAFDILVTLVERRGELVSNADLLERVWRETTVDESSLRVHMSALRKVLGDDRAGQRYIHNEPGRGYCFVGDVVENSGSATGTRAPADASPWKPTPPPRLNRTIGREDFVRSVAGQLPEGRFVTITGPGGIGKTTVAIEVGEKIVEAYADGGCFADLATLKSPNLLPSAVASLLGLGIYSEDPTPGLVAFLRDRQVLLLFDNCEHLVDAAAALAEAILAGAKRVHILATSREPLRAAGEWVYRLPPLPQPPSGTVTAADAMRFPAMQLFVERARATNGDLVLTDENSAVAADLCRRLDGIPLALEFAAARVDEFGLRDLSDRLDRTFSLMMTGRRTAIPRQRTLRATLDWSHELLSDDEKITLRRISVFAGRFQHESAEAIGAFGGHSIGDVRETMTSLVSKSIVSADVSGDVTGYRLFDTTRQYALEKLMESHEYDDVRSRHAEYLATIFEKSEADFEKMAAPRWKQTYSPYLDDIRAALDWAYSPTGAPAIGVRLTATSALLWTQLALMAEHRTLVQRAIEHNAASSKPDRVTEMRLLAARGSLFFHTMGPLVDEEAHASFDRCVALADELGDEPNRVRALTGCCAIRIMRGNYPDALRFAARFSESASGAGSPAAHRTLAHNLHYLGDLVRARRHLDEGLAVADAARLRNTSGVQYDHRITVHTILARTLWLSGKTAKAMELARACVEDALALDHAISLCLTLSTCACPLAFVVGGRPAAQSYLDLLRNTALEHSAVRWQHWADAYDIAMTTREERRDSPLEARMRQLAESPIDGPQLENIAIFGDAFTDERLVERAAAGTGGWCAAEMLRAQGAIILRRDGNQSRAESLFRKSLALARAMETRAWELRTATSLAQLLSHTGRTEEAGSLLGPVVRSFARGADSIDLRSAMDTLERLE